MPIREKVSARESWLVAAVEMAEIRIPRMIEAFDDGPHVTMTRPSVPIPFTCQPHTARGRGENGIAIAVLVPDMPLSKQGYVIAGLIAPRPFDGDSAAQHQ